MSDDDNFMKRLDDYNVEQDKYKSHAHSGKGRSKKEARQHHRDDENGHTRKKVKNLINNANNNKKHTLQAEQ